MGQPETDTPHRGHLHGSTSSVGIDALKWTMTHVKGLSTLLWYDSSLPQHEEVACHDADEEVLGNHVRYVPMYEVASVEVDDDDVSILEHEVIYHDPLARKECVVHGIPVGVEDGLAPVVAGDREVDLTIEVIHH